MNHVVVGTAGHIDHGKSTLVKALTGSDPDRLPEEKARGITIDLGFAHAAWGGCTYSFVDVPGHERFVRTMVAGAHGIDVALLVVASDDGVMPQTREHLAILTLLGVRAGAVARTKSDLTDAETGTRRENEIADLLRGSALDGADVVAVSAVAGTGLDALRDALEAAARRAGPRPASGVARLFVDRAFAMRGFGPVVTGTLTGGPLRVEDRLTLLPHGRDVRVKRLETHGAACEVAEPGRRTSVNLAGVDLPDLPRGAALAAPGLVAPTSVLTVRLTLLPDVPAVAEGTRLRVHLGTADEEARLHLLPGPRLPGGGTAFAQLLLAAPVPALRGDRFVVRRPSPVETLGGGAVLDTARPKAKALDPSLAAALATLASGSEKAIAGLLVREAGPDGVSAAALAPRLAVPAARAAAVVDSLLRDGTALRLLPGVAATPDAAPQMVERAARLFEERRRSGAPSPLVAKGEFLARFGRGLAPDRASAWLPLLAAAGRLVVEGDVVGPPGTRPGDLTVGSAPHAERIAAAWKAGGFDPPRFLDLARDLHLKTQVVEGLVAHLVKLGTLVRLAPDVVLHQAVVDAALARLAPLQGRTMRVGDFRDLWGLSRKTLIPLLEHADRMKKTVRRGDVRVVL